MFTPDGDHCHVVHWQHLRAYVHWTLRSKHLPERSLCAEPQLNWMSENLCFYCTYCTCEIKVYSLSQQTRVRPCSYSPQMLLHFAQLIADFYFFFGREFFFGLLKIQEHSNCPCRLPSRWTCVTLSPPSGPIRLQQRKRVWRERSEKDFSVWESKSSASCCPLTLRQLRHSLRVSGAPLATQPFTTHEARQRARLSPPPNPQTRPSATTNDEWEWSPFTRSVIFSFASVECDPEVLVNHNPVLLRRVHLTHDYSERPSPPHPLRLLMENEAKRHPLTTNVIFSQGVAHAVAVWTAGFSTSNWLLDLTVESRCAERWRHVPFLSESHENCWCIEFIREHGVCIGSKCVPSRTAKG